MVTFVTREEKALSLERSAGSFSNEATQQKPQELHPLTVQPCPIFGGSRDFVLRVKIAPLARPSTVPYRGSPNGKTRENPIAAQLLESVLDCPIVQHVGRKPPQDCFECTVISIPRLYFNGSEVRAHENHHLPCDGCGARAVRRKPRVDPLRLLEKPGSVHYGLRVGQVERPGYWLYVTVRTG